MTWIIGCPTIFGYGFLISDVRVTLDGKPSRVSIQKVHPVGHFLMAGFSGSVEFGFFIVAALQKSIAAHGPGVTVQPGKFYFSVYRHIRRSFEECSPNVKALGSQIILMGASPALDNGIPGQAVVTGAILRSRDGFVPRILRATVPPYTIDSIGNGRAVQPYADALERQAKNTDIILGTPVPGAYSYMFAYPLRLAIQENPDPSVSDYLQIMEVSRAGFRLNDTAGKLYPPDGDPIEVKVPPLARSWEEFCNRTWGASLDTPQAAVC